MHGLDDPAPPIAGGRPAPDQDGLIRCCLLQSRRQLRCVKVRLKVSATATAEPAFIARRPAIPWENTMKNPLDSLWGTIISGLVLTAILYYVVKSIPL
jgi:hypothetical protein